MIFLDDEKRWILARDRQELLSVLIEFLDPETVDFHKLAAACFNCDDLDIILLEE